MNHPELRRNEEIMSRLQAIHTPEAIQARLQGGPDHSYLRDFIYGAIDGSVTTFAVVTGVAGAQLSASIIIIMGIANLLADGFSMAVSNFLGTRAEHQQQDRARAEEHHHIRHFPEGEREEVRQIFAAKGFTGRDLERAVQIITSDHDQWVETMLRDELGLALEVRSPWRAAVSTFAAFAICGAIPLAPFVVNMMRRPEAQSASISVMLLLSILATGATFFIVGALKSRFVQQKWYMAGLETLAMGSGAALLAYFVGVMLKGIVPA